MGLSMRFRMSDKNSRNGIGYFSVLGVEDFGPVREAMDNRDPRLGLVKVVYEREDDDEIVSAINENWTAEGLEKYFSMVAAYGEKYFCFCEALGTRNPDGFGETETFNSFADAGCAVAERYFGVPKGGMKYVDATRLARDIMNGEGPPELPDDLSIFSGPNGDPIYMIEEAFPDTRDDARQALKA